MLLWTSVQSASNFLSSQEVMEMAVLEVLVEVEVEVIVAPEPLKDDLWPGQFSSARCRALHCRLLPRHGAPRHSWGT